MTYLRYWAVVGFLLLGVAITAGLPDVSKKWSHVVVGFYVLPLVWSMHYVRKQKWTFYDPATWAGVLLFVALAGALMAGNAYAGMLGWFGLTVGVVVFLGVRSLTAEHQPVFHIGLVSIGVLWVGWSLLATKTSLALPWVPVLAKDPVTLVALAILPLAAGIMMFKRQTLWKNVLLVIGCAVLVVPFALPSFYTRVRQDWQTTAALAPAYVNIAKSHFLLGVGSGNSQYLYPNAATNRALLPDRPPSSVLDVVTSYGVISTLLFVALLVTSLFGLRQQSRKTRYVLVLAIVVTQALCWVANLWQYPALWLSWWVLLGLCASPVTTSEVQDAGTRRFFRYTVLTISALIALQAIVMGLGLNRFAAAERAALSADTKNAAKLYAVSLRFDPDPEQRRAYAESLWLNTYQNKNLAEAERQARLAYQWNRNDAFARQIAARVAYSQSNYNDAERLYLETLDRDPYFSLDVYVALADVYKKQGKTTEERDIIQEGLKQYPDSPTLSDVANPVCLTQLQQMQKRFDAIPKQK
ncbi:MAG: hypothetical protein AAB549_03725 [Patescibacteria group bacterium]